MTPSVAARGLDRSALDREVQAIVASHPGPMRAALWLGGAEGAAWYERDASVPYPTASVIKTAYLVELFAAHAGALDAPPPGIAAVLAAGDHPALAPFSAGQLDDVRRALGRASVRRIGEIMMARTRASNHVYNAAANLTTAILGGPGGLTRRIHARDAAFRPIVVRRYMLAERRDGDNTASAASLGAVVQRLASRRMPGVDGRTARAMQDAVRTRPTRSSGIHRAKSGYLPSSPVVSAFCGWWQSGRHSIVYVVVTSAPRPARRGGGESSDPVMATAFRIRNLLLRRAKTAR